MDKLKDYVPFATVLFFAIGAFRIMLFGEHYHVNIYNLISVSNLLVYIFDVLRGLLLYSIPVVFFIIFKTKLASLCKTRISIAFAAIGLLISILVFTNNYYNCTMTYTLNWDLKWVLLAGIFCVGVIFRNIRWIENFELVKISLLICFLFGYLKVEFKYGLIGINNAKNNTISEIHLKNHDNKDSTITTNNVKYIIHYTADFVFLYNEADSSITPIPMSNISFLTTSIADKSRKVK